MRDKVVERIRQYRMLEPGGLVTVALSGGADSVALLHLLCALREEWKISVRAAHVEHGLRGAESLRDRRFVEELCAAWGVPLDVQALKDLPAQAKAAGQSVEECAREARYRYFATLREQHGGCTATAHTLSDSLETALFNLARGTGLRGLLGVPPVRGAVVRPLTACTRQEVEQYCHTNGLHWVEDSTNYTEAYARNRLRLAAVPALRTVNPAVERAYARLSGHLEQDEDYLSTQAAQALERCRATSRAGVAGLDANRLAALHPAMRYRVLAAFLAQYGLRADSVKAELIDSKLQTAHFALELVGGQYAEVINGLLLVRKQPPPRQALFVTPVKPGRFPLGNGQIAVISLTIYEHSEQKEKIGGKHLKNWLDYDRISGDLVLRWRQEGDQMRLAGSTMTKSLKKLFQEAHIPPEERQNTPMLADVQGVVWVHGLGCAERVRVRETSKTILTVEIAEDLQ